MTRAKALKVLKQHQAYRTDEHVPPRVEMPIPSELGIALGIAIKELSQPKRLKIKSKR